MESVNSLSVGTERIRLRPDIYDFGPDLLAEL